MCCSAGLRLAQSGQRRHQRRIAAQRPGRRQAQSCCKAIAVGPLGRQPQRPHAQPSPTPVRQLWLAEPIVQCGGKPRHDRRTHRRARHIRERGRSGWRERAVGWLAPPVWRSAKHQRAARLGNARARRRLVARLVATCARGSEYCEFAARCAANHAANRPCLCQLPVAGKRHPRLLAKMDTPASLQHEGHRVPPLRCGGTSRSQSFPLLSVGRRMLRLEPGRARQGQGVHQPTPPNTQRARYGRRWLGLDRQTMPGESPGSVRRPPRLGRGRLGRSPTRRRRGPLRSRLYPVAALCAARGWPSAMRT